MATILVTGARAPVALHWARLLTSAGHRVILADSLQVPLAAATRMKALYVRLPAPRGQVAIYADAVADLVAREACDLVLPTCEEVFYLAAARDFHHPGLPVFAPDFDRLAAVHDKARFALLAAELGAAPAETMRLASVDDVAALGARAHEMVLKPVWSRFGSRVLIRPDAAALARLAPSAADPWVAQTYLPGAEYCCFALARQGQVLAVQAYRNLYRAGTGAGLAFEPVERSDIFEFVRAFVKKTAWTGQVSFDFRLDAQGALKAIECDPRATSGLHFFASGAGLAEALIAGAPAKASGTDAMTLPLAMIVYGLPEAIRSRRLGQWRHDFAHMRDFCRWEGDRSTLPAQLLALAEIIAVALRSGTGLKTAATVDIEWNGEALDPRSGLGG